MKYQIIKLIFLVFFLFGINLIANDFKYGIEAGYDLNFPYTNDFNSNPVLLRENPFDFMNSYNINAYLDYEIAEKLSVSVEPGFIQKGALLRHYNTRFEFNYIQLPVLLHIQIFDKFNLMFGPEIAYSLNSQTGSKSYLPFRKAEVNYRTEFSLLLGLSYNILQNFDLGIKYNSGLGQIIHTTHYNETGQMIGKSEENNKYLQLFLRVYFHK